MSPPTGTQRPLEILLVEDHRDARTTMRMLLTLQHGHVVHEAADGASAVRLAIEVEADIALIDIGLPDMSGHEVARLIRATPRGKRIVLAALTGHGAEEDRRLSHEAGFDFHLVKPVETARLTEVFEAAGRNPA